MNICPVYNVIVKYDRLGSCEASFLTQMHLFYQTSGLAILAIVRSTSNLQSIVPSFPIRLSSWYQSTENGERYRDNAFEFGN